MEPASKRRRIVETPDQLHDKRARNDLRLKSRFESIFEKFSKDFTGVGDEIDLATGKVLVNNGHLITMQSEQDVEGLANEEDELGAEAFLTSRLLDPTIANDNAPAGTWKNENQPTVAVALPNEVSCVGLNIAAAIKMDDGTCYDNEIHGELYINRNILDQLSRLGPHIRKSIAYVKRSAATSNIVSIETEDLSIDPKWRAPVLLRQDPDANVAGVVQPQQIVPESDPEPERSPSPEGRSLWALGDSPPLRKGAGQARWSTEEDSLLWKLKSEMKLNAEQCVSKFSGRSYRAIQQRWSFLKHNDMKASPASASELNELNTQSSRPASSSTPAIIATDTNVESPDASYTNINVGHEIISKENTGSLSKHACLKRKRRVAAAHARSSIQIRKVNQRTSRCVNKGKMDSSPTPGSPVGDETKEAMVDPEPRASRSRRGGKLLSCDADCAVTALEVRGMQRDMTDEMLSKSTIANKRFEDNQKVRNRRGCKSRPNESTNLTSGDDTIRGELQIIDIDNSSSSAATKSQPRTVTNVVAPVASKSTTMFTERGNKSGECLENQGISEVAAQVTQEPLDQGFKESRLRRGEKERKDVSILPHISASDPPTGETAAKTIRKRGRPWPKSSKSIPEAVLAASNRLQEISAIEPQSAPLVLEKVGPSEKNRSRPVTPDPLSNFPDSVASDVYTRDDRFKSSSQSRSKRKAVGHKIKVTPKSGKRRSTAAGSATTISFSSIIGDASDDELSHAASTIQAFKAIP